VEVSAAQSLNVADLNYVDVAMACAAALFREVTDQARGIKIPTALWKDVLNLLTNEITVETTIRVPKSGSMGAKVNALVVSIEGKYGKETETRQTLRKRLFPYLNDLLQQANGVCQEIEQVTGRPPLIIFEDLDKPDLADAHDLFFEHATTLNSMACRIVYTFPISLSYSSDFAGYIGDYSWHFLLPNVSLYQRDNTPDAEGHATLKAVVTRRVSESLFGDGALDEIIELSGGLMRDLIRLGRGAALMSLTAGASAITPAILQQVAAEIANAYRRSLLPAHYDALRKAQETREIIPDDTVRQLLQNLSLLEYRNTEAWCNVHPIVRPLLE
jgi:hypothetical protein